MSLEILEKKMRIQGDIQGRRENLRGPGQNQPRFQGLCDEAVTKILIKFILSFQNFREKSHAQ